MSSKNILENFNSFQGNQVLGLNTDFALTSQSNDFIQVYDINAPNLFPDLFYLPPPQPKPSQPIPNFKNRTLNDSLEDHPAMRLWLGGLTFVGLFILYRCVMKSD